jgi:hypothetical protein
MSLILAIEPDRRQVAHLISIVRHVKGAELILADTTERALESIGNSVPDLILVPALLSPSDDAALAAALRVIATAAHVQMLTIPTFATPQPQPKKGVLSAFRRKPANDVPLDGCDPKVFAEEIASYLERASEERAAAQLYEAEAPRAEVSETVEAAWIDPVEEETAYVAEPEVAQTEEDAPAEPFSPIYASSEPNVDEVYAAPEETLETIAEPDPVVEPEPVAAMYEAEPLPVEEPEADLEIPVAAAPAFDEFVATVEHTTAVDEEPGAADEIEPLAAAAPEFEDLLADFERTNLAVIEEVHAEEWMAETFDDENETAEDEADDLDIDLSIELDAVLHAEASTAPPLKPFEPVVPVERYEPLPLAAWQAWPRLDWTPPEKPAVLDAHAGNGNVNGNGHHHAPVPETSIVEDFDQVAEFEEALDAEESLQPFEPVVPAERLEPMPMAAWHVWPRMEGVASEAYQEPIAPRKAAAKPEWVELMRSLREDIARRRAELTASGPVAPPPQKPQRPKAAETRVKAARPASSPAPAPATSAAPAPSPAPEEVPADEKKPRPKRTRPIEDEWGLFDPEQCGFAALLDKLDEITVTPPSSRRPER